MPPFALSMVFVPNFVQNAGARMLVVRTRF